MTKGVRRSVEMLGLRARSGRHPLGLPYRVPREQGGANRCGKRGRRPRSSHRERRRLRERCELVPNAGEMPRGRGADHDEPRLERLRRVASVPSGVSGPRYAMRQPRARSARPKAISGRSCSSPGAQARTASGPRALSPAARQAEQTPAHDVAREVLLGDARSARLPALAEVVQVRDEEITQERVEAQGRERPVERRLGRGLVEALERLREGARVQAPPGRPAGALGRSPPRARAGPPRRRKGPASW